MKKYKHRLIKDCIAEERQDGYGVTIADIWLYLLPFKVIEECPTDWELVEERKYNIGDWIKLNGKEERVGQIHKFLFNSYNVYQIRIDKINTNPYHTVYAEDIKCKVKPVTLWFNVYKEYDHGVNYKVGLYTYSSEEKAKSMQDHPLEVGKYFDTKSLTIYEEIS